MRRWWHTTMRHTVTKQKTYKIVETYLRPRPIYMYTYIFSTSRSSFSYAATHPVSLTDAPLIWTFGDRCSPSNDPSGRRTDGRVLRAPLSRPWGATQGWPGRVIRWPWACCPAPTPLGGQNRRKHGLTLVHHRPEDDHEVETVTRPPIKSKFVSSRGLEAVSLRGGRERRELSVGWLGSTFIEAGMKYRGPRLRRELFIAGMMLAFPCWH